nr:hypothetical protein [Tanacetum cinerariifolium]
MVRQHLRTIAESCLLQQQNLRNLDPYSSDTLEVEAVVLTLATTGLLREYRTLDLLSMIPKQSRGILSRKLPPAAEFKES